MPRIRAIGVALALASVWPGVLDAHERFVKHDVLTPFPHDFFVHIDHNVLDIAVRVALTMVAVLFLWFRRHAIQTYVQTQLVANLGSRARHVVYLVMQYVTDKPVEARWFTKVSEWAVILFLRCPALVLMYAASNSSLVMTTYPLPEAGKVVFQYVSVALGIAIITQLALPACGIAIFAVFGYILLAYDWWLAVDVLPVLSVAVVYLTLPWDSHRRPIYTLDRRQMRFVRLVLGFSFFALGWMKIYNPDDVIGVAQNFPTVMSDPLIRLFYCGTDPELQAGCWLIAFALCEVLSGFLVMVGAFSRAWAVQMVFVFTKLMVVDFGWPEIPHLYPIGGFFLLAFSNTLTNELEPLAPAITERRWRRRWTTAVSIATAAVMAGLIIFPPLYGLTLTQRPFLRAPTTTSAARTAARTITRPRL